MLYAVLFEDNTDLAHMRSKHMPDHLTFLETHADTIRSAGPLEDTADETPAGGLWLVEAEDTKAVGRLVETDPLWPTGLRKTVRILRWTQVYADGERRI